jgi:DnaJ-domain-containing protein 1
MIDHFRVLHEPRRPWIDISELKTKFLALSAIHHPDRSHSSSVSEPIDFAALNVAYNCLRDVPLRVAHLIELETGEKPPVVQSIPGELMDWAFEAGALLREADQFIAEKARNSSPMIAIKHFEKGMQFSDRLIAMQGRIQQALSPLNERLRQMNDIWNGIDGDGPARSSQLPVSELGGIYQRYAFLNRWNQQIQERISTLAL